MTDYQHGRNEEHTTPVADGRRRELRTLLVMAANTARQTRRGWRAATRAGQSTGQAVRDRVSMLLSAAG